MIPSNNLNSRVNDTESRVVPGVAGQVPASDPRVRQIGSSHLPQQGNEAVPTQRVQIPQSLADLARNHCTRMLTIQGDTTETIKMFRGLERNNEPGNNTYLEKTLVKLKIQALVNTVSPLLTDGARTLLQNCLTNKEVFQKLEIHLDQLLSRNESLDYKNILGSMAKFLAGTETESLEEINTLLKDQDIITNAEGGFDSSIHLLEQIKDELKSYQMTPEQKNNILKELCSRGLELLGVSDLKGRVDVPEERPISAALSIVGPAVPLQNRAKPETTMLDRNSSSAGVSSARGIDGVAPAMIEHLSSAIQELRNTIRSHQGALSPREIGDYLYLLDNLEINLNYHTNSLKSFERYSSDFTDIQRGYYQALNKANLSNVTQERSSSSPVTDTKIKALETEIENLRISVGRNLGQCSPQILEDMNTKITLLLSRLNPSITTEEFQDIKNNYFEIQRDVWRLASDSPPSIREASAAGVSRASSAVGVSRASSAVSAGSGPISTIANGITSHMPNQAAAQQAITSTVSINERFTRTESLNNQIRAHEEAKTWVKENLALVGSAIEFVSPPAKPTGSLAEVSIPEGTKLNPAIFGWQTTAGVTQDIQRDGRSQGEEINLYGVASQYNSGECGGKATIAPGMAVFGYEYDPTQGPKAQIAYSNEQAELINCGANRGFNGLIHVLDEETKGEIAHGYFTPSQEKYPQVLRQLQENGHKMEFSCVGGVPKGGTRPVYEILVAAPAFADYLSADITGQPLTKEQQNNLAFVCAVHSWRAQFEECIALAKATGKPVHFKPAAIGLGVFGNEVEVFNKAFYKTAQEYQEQLVQNHVKVTFQVYMDGSSFQHDRKAKAVADALLVKRTA